ncbi:mini-chromosome maintenance complex-binding protein-like isoform X2 [Symsagittifera roscoffensis]|uniref:mini-chromosome maintenance complex-binding protein-like isoform X2 n=1 Tax=Symsagittifera roscoffensis TaxID=84072 RepID=UPI00307B42A9
MSDQPWIDAPFDYVQSLNANYSHENPKNLLKIFADSFKHRLLGSNSKLDLFCNDAYLEQSNSKLCVVRGMLQDFGESELFVLNYKTSNNTAKIGPNNNVNQSSTAFLKDSTIITEELVLDQENVNYADRLSLKVTPVPGEGSWVVDNLRSKFNVKESSSLSSESEEGSKSAKLRRCDDGSGVIMKGLDVKFYGEDSDVVLNSVYLFYGVFEKVTVNNNAVDEFLMEHDKQASASSLPSNFIFHAIFAQPVLSAVVDNILTVTSEDTIDQSCAVLRETRPLLMSVLTELFGGDSTTAEWTLLHLISSVYKRADTMPIALMVSSGNLTLNITNSSRDVVKKLTQLLQSILPNLVYFPMTVESLNKSKLIPHKDVETGVLHTGVLQLPPGSSVIIDETCMEPGTLDESGLANLAALTTLIQNQKVYYDFKFQNVELLTNYNVIIMSSTSSLVKSSALRLKMKPTAEPSMPRCAIVSIEQAYALRKYLTIAKFLQYEVPLEMSEIAQKHFVQSRQENKQYSADDFHHMLNTARLVSLSKGCSKLNEECWQKAKQLVNAQMEQSK